jgi:5-formyltetrahydrofolate cyclo-ligase
MNFIDHTKEEIRKKLLEERKTFDEYKYDEKNEAICKNTVQVINSLPKIFNVPGNSRGIPNIGLYWPLKGEPDLLKIAMLIENHIELPKLKDPEMVFVRYHPGDFVEKVRGFSNLYQPVSQNEMMPSVVVIPGIAFSIDGYRIGFGKGLYDMYLSKIRKIYTPVTIGVCFHEHLYEQLPIESYDQQLDYIVTNEVIIKI